MLKVVIHRTQVISDETRQTADGRRCDLWSHQSASVPSYNNQSCPSYRHWVGSLLLLLRPPHAPSNFSPETGKRGVSWKLKSPSILFQVLPKFLIIFSPLFRCIHVGRGLVVGVWSLKHFWKRCQSNFTIFWKVHLQRSLRVATKLCGMDKLPKLDSAFNCTFYLGEGNPDLHWILRKLPLTALLWILHLKAKPVIN